MEDWNWIIFIFTDFATMTKYVARVPTRAGKPGKMGRHFPVREKSGNFDQTGKVREKPGKIMQNTGKLREFQTNIICYSSVTAKLICILLAKFDKVFS